MKLNEIVDGVSVGAYVSKEGTLVIIILDDAVEDAFHIEIPLAS